MFMSNITKKILILANSGKTVFSTNDLALMWKIQDKNTLRVIIHRAKQREYLEPIKKGIYKLNQKKVDIFELAGKLKKNSYLSFESVLAQAGIVHQWYDEIILASSRNLFINNKYGKFVYRQLPEGILANRLGIVKKDNYFIACPERALCDKVYKDGLIYFDDLASIDRELILDISRMYNKRVMLDIKKLLDIK